MRDDRASWPNFFIVGAAKAGTTFLWSQLRRHPDIFFPEKKEFHYFSDVHPTGRQRVLIQAVTDEQAYLRYFRTASTHHITGEASPSYLWDSETPGRIRARIPDARCLIILRNPIDRAFSHYLMDVGLGIQKLDFHAALLEDLNRTPKGWGVSHLYLELGLYAEQVKRYYEIFPEHQVLVLYAPDLVAHPQEGLDAVCCFLGINPAGLRYSPNQVEENAYAVPRHTWQQWVLQRHTLKTFSARWIPRTIRHALKRRWTTREDDRPAMDPDAYAWLSEYYRISQEALESLLGDQARCLRVCRMKPR